MGMKQKRNCSYQKRMKREGKREQKNVKLHTIGSYCTGKRTGRQRKVTIHRTPQRPVN